MKNIICAFLLASISLFSFGQFEMNKGQVRDYQWNFHDEVHFTLHQDGENIYFTNEGIIYHYFEIQPAELDLIESGRLPNPYTDEEWEQIRYQISNNTYEGIANKTTGKEYRVDMTFPGAKLDNAVGEKEALEKNHYYLPGKTIKDVSIFERVRYLDAYPGIDLIFYKQDGKLKYDFEIKPNANPKDIKILYIGHQDIKITEEGNLNIQIVPGEIIEEKPVSFQNEKEINTHFKLDGDTISFEIEKYNKNELLTIDPAVIWSTYFQTGYTSGAFMTSKPVWDTQGNMFFAVSSYNVNFPMINPGGLGYYNITPGSNGLQLIMMKFNTDRQIVWSTYYPSTGSSRTNFGSTCIAIDYADNIYVTGAISTQVVSGYPTPAFDLFNPGNGAYYETNVAGNELGFILKFASSGERLWATMLDPTTATKRSMLRLTGLDVDSQNNVIAAGYAYAPGSSWGYIPLANPGGNHYYKGSTNEAQIPTLHRFTSNCALDWGTYIAEGQPEVYNGSHEPGTIVGVDQNDNIFVVGNASDTYNLKNPGGGAYQDGSAPLGRKMSFFKFNADGSLYWNTLLGGQNSTNSVLWQDPSDMIFGENGDLYVVGRSNCTDFPIVDPGNGAYVKNHLSAGSSWVQDGMVIQFSNNGVLKWCTYIGGDGTSDGTELFGIAKNSNDDILIAGHSRSTNTYPIMNKPGSHNQSSQSADYSAVFTQFDKNGVMKWSTYYGDGIYTRPFGFAGKDLARSGGSCGADGVYVAWYRQQINLTNSMPIVDPGNGALFNSTPESGMNFSNVFIELGEGDIITEPEQNTTSTASICASETKNLTTDGSGAGNWSIISGGGSISGSSYTAGNVSTSTNVTIRYEDPCGNHDDVTFIVNPLPSAPVANDQSFCDGATIADLVPAQGGNIKWHPSPTSSGVYLPGYNLSDGQTVYVSQTQNGCQSPRTPVTITINDTQYSTDTRTACSSFTWIDGNTYTSNNNTATHTLTSKEGCDSIVTLNLTINQPVTGVDTQFSCGNFTWIDGNTYSSNNNSATHTILGGAANGCDSIVTLNLTVGNVKYSTDTQVACGSFTWIDGNTYTSSNNTATHTLASVENCDSIVTLNLTINQPTTGVDIQFSCGDFTWIDGNTYTSSNSSATHTITGGAANGCDSIVTLHLTVGNTKYGTDVQFACSSFTWIDGNTYTSDNNTATFTTTSIEGCDSIVTLDLTINEVSTGIDTQVSCGDFTWIDGNTYSADNNSATHTIVGGAANGCDSIVTLNLIIHETTDVIDIQNACESFTWIDGNTYTTNNNTASVTLQTIEGCDSIVTLDLTIHQAARETHTETACGSFKWGINGEVYTTSGIYYDTIYGVTTEGCDSIYTLALTITTSNIDITLDSKNNVNCQGGEDGSASVSVTGGSGNYTYSWTDQDGEEISTSSNPENLTEGVYTVIVIDDMNCSASLPVVISSDNQSPLISVSSNSITICEEEDIHLFANSSADNNNPSYTWEGPNGYTSEERNPSIENGNANQSGEYSVYVISNEGCSSDTLKVQVTINAKPIADINVNSTIICEGGTIIFNSSNEDVTYEWNGPNGFTSTEQNPYIENAGKDAEGEYTLEVTSDEGCKSEETSVQIIISTDEIDEDYFEEELIFCKGDNMIITPKTVHPDVTYEWVFEGETISMETTLEITDANLENSGAYQIYEVNAGGCTHLAGVINVKVLPCDVIISETFSPNGDGTNDYFTIGNLEAYPNTEVWIYTRWGMEIYHSEDYQNDWDGTSFSNLGGKGEILPEGTYYYVVKIGGNNESQADYGETYKGFVYLKR